MKSIFKNTKVPVAYAPIKDVGTLNSGFFDDTESFFFAEVMKYLCASFVGCSALWKLIVYAGT